MSGGRRRLSGGVAVGGLRGILHVLAAGAVLLGCGEPGSLRLRLAHAAPPQSVIGLAATEFARVANERLAGQAEVVVYGSGQLGTDREVLQKLKLGTVDFSVPSTVMSSEVPAMAFFDMPYVVEDRDHMLSIEEEIFWPDLAPLAEDLGYRVLALWENGFRHITNSRRPIFAPEDLAGVKIRTPNSPWRVSLFRAWGANPSPMSFSELFLALQTGVMDGQENPLSNIRNASLHEVQPYLSLTGHVYSPAYLTVRIEHWMKVPAEVRSIVETVARETQAFVLETARDTDARILAELRASGMEINEVDPSLFLDASRVVYDEFDAKVAGGGSWIQEALALAEERKP